MSSGWQAKTDEYRWPVVDTREPQGVRVPVGYVTILIRATEEGEPLAYNLILSSADGLTLQSFDPETLDIFYDAAQAALKEMGLRHWEDRAIIGDIIRS